jgi:hypothetical protein
MPQIDFNSWEEKKEEESSLSRSLSRLMLRTYENNLRKKGLSRNFLSQVDSVESVLEKCDKAMRVLSEEYINCLERFKESRNSLEALDALHLSEEIWNREAGVIRFHDGRGEESAFLDKMRGQALMVFEDKLLEVSKVCRKNPSQEHVELCLALLGVVDQVLSEQGYPEESHERTQIRETALSFK